MDLSELMQTRHSIRQYTGENIPDDLLNNILEAALLAPSGHNHRPQEYIEIRDRETLRLLSKCRPSGPQMLAEADAAIVVMGDESLSDTWPEDCSIAMFAMHLMAHSLGVGSCWVQVRNRKSPDGGTAEDYLRDLLEIPENYRIEAILALGMPGEKKDAADLDELSWDKIHAERF